MLTGHNYIVFLSGKYRGCDFPNHKYVHLDVQTAWYYKANLLVFHADPGYPHPFPVCLMFTTLLDISFSPQVQFLFFFPDIFPCISRCSNTITSAWFSSAYLTIAPAIFLPSSVFRRFVYAHLPCVCAEPCSPLESADPSQCAVHPVCFVFPFPRLHDT